MKTGGTRGREGGERGGEKERMASAGRVSVLPATAGRLAVEVAMAGGVAVETARRRGGWHLAMEAAAAGKVAVAGRVAQQAQATCPVDCRRDRHTNLRTEKTKKNDSEISNMS